jgi:hypothetical protein
MVMHALFPGTPIDSPDVRERTSGLDRTTSQCEESLSGEASLWLNVTAPMRPL